MSVSVSVEGENGAASVRSEVVSGVDADDLDYYGNSHARFRINTTTHRHAK